MAELDETERQWGRAERGARTRPPRPTRPPGPAGEDDAAGDEVELRAVGLDAHAAAARARGAAVVARAERAHVRREPLGGLGGPRAAAVEPAPTSPRSSSRPPPRAPVVVASADDTAAPQSAGALPRRKTKRVPTKKGDVKEHVSASQKTRQQGTPTHGCTCKR